MAMIKAAKGELRVSSLAAVRLFGKKPHLGHQLSTAELYPGIGLANSNTTTRLPVCLYDSVSRSRSWNRYAYVLGNPLALTDPDGQDPNCGPSGSWDGEGCTAGPGGQPVNTNPMDSCAYASTGSGDASCGSLPGLWDNGIPIYGAGVASSTGSASSGNSGSHGSGHPGTVGVYGGGNTGPFVFSFADGSDPAGQWTSVLNQPWAYNTLTIFSNFSAGAADFLTLGLTKRINQWDGGATTINYNGGTYNAGKVVGAGLTIALAVGGGATVAAIADGKNGAYFGRGTATLFNSGKVRFGWNWVGPARGGRDVIRLGIGPARGTSWWSHIIFWYPKAP